MINLIKEEKRSRSLSRPKVLEMLNKQYMKPQKMNKSIDKLPGRQFLLGKCSNQGYQDEKTNAFSRTKSTYIKDSAPLNAYAPPILDQNSKKTQTTTATSKISDLRHLLPNYLNFRLPQDLAQLCAITYKLDEYLSKLPKIPKMKNKSQSFINIQLYFQIEHKISIQVFHLKQINFIVFSFYKFYQDPLKNLIIQYPISQNIYVRQQTFRKIIYDYHIKSISEQRDNDLVPIRQFLIKKTARFYQKKKFKEPKNAVGEEKSQIKQQFIDKIIENVKRIQEKHKKCLQEATDTKLKKQNIKSIKGCIDEIYRQQKVNNMYKATLVQLVEQKMNMGVQLILKGLSHLLAINQNMNEIIVKDRPIISYEFDTKYV